MKLGVRAPEFPQDVDWFNTPHPLGLGKDLKGKVVLIDFWTFCCINCMHVLPDLKRLEKKYSEELVVIGAHSAKFNNEKISENIRKSLMRYEIEHPVFNDHDMILWRASGVSAWPTLLLVDTQGRAVLQVSGEGNYEILDAAIQELIRIGERDGTLKRGVLPLRPEQDQKEAETLRFPGKIRAYPGRLVITDSNHNRIVITDVNGKIEEIIGSGEEGRSDGDFSAAQFHHPQGAILSGDFIYIADTENHLLRRADLKNKIVETIAGTGDGMRTRPMFEGQPQKALRVPLNSPWDVAQLGDFLYIAMAGSHQIWRYDLKKHDIKTYAGTGAESIVDGAIKHSAFSQPSGIVSDGTSRLYIADSEVSAVRWIDTEKEQVYTLVGTGLFDFGDRDGSFESALFQHGLGVDAAGNKVYFADTYNDRIKELNLETKRVESIFGRGKEGYKDGAAGEAGFFEPGGLSVLDDKIYVADTNNHKIRVCDLKTKQVSTLEIKFEGA
ncbi:MAG: redoxin domain-containing protein [Candidatus Omnitrophica bacterium]|nr:redoxin domain-containing protein [Candidatus Omnitrophota bacterium]